MQELNGAIKYGIKYGIKPAHHRIDIPFWCFQYLHPKIIALPYHRGGKALYIMRLGPPFSIQLRMYKSSKIPRSSMQTHFCPLLPDTGNFDVTESLRMVSITVLCPQMIWVKYNDLTTTSLESVLMKEIIAKWPSFSLVK